LEDGALVLYGVSSTYFGRCAVPWGDGVIPGTGRRTGHAAVLRLAYPPVASGPHRIGSFERSLGKAKRRGATITRS